MASNSILLTNRLVSGMIIQVAFRTGILKIIWKCPIQFRVWQNNCHFGVPTLWWFVSRTPKRNPLSGAPKPLDLPYLTTSREWLDDWIKTFFSSSGRWGHQKLDHQRQPGRAKRSQLEEAVKQKANWVTGTGKRSRPPWLSWFIRRNERWPRPGLFAVYRWIILPTYIGIRRSQYEDRNEPTSIKECHKGFVPMLKWNTACYYFKDHFIVIAAHYRNPETRINQDFM